MGWSAVAEFAGRTVGRAPTPAMKEALRKEATEAAARALRLDPRNPEALDVQASLLDRNDLAAKEAKLLAAVAARPLDCGCQHQHYGMMLSEVGRAAEAIAHYRRVNDLMPIDPAGAIALSEMYARAGDVESYARQMERIRDYNSDWPNMRVYNQIVINNALFTRDYAPAVAVLRGDQNLIPAARRPAYLAAYEALANGDPAARTRAVPAIMTQARDPKLISQLTVSLLGALGASREALEVNAMLGSISPGAARDTLMMPTMAEARKLPQFAALAETLGLMRYWRATKKKPDFCTASDAPEMCARI